MYRSSKIWWKRRWLWLRWMRVISSSVLASNVRRPARASRFLRNKVFRKSTLVGNWTVLNLTASTSSTPTQTSALVPCLKTRGIRGNNSIVLGFHPSNSTKYKCSLNLHHTPFQHLLCFPLLLSHSCRRSNSSSSNLQIGRASCRERVF